MSPAFTFLWAVLLCMTFITVFSLFPYSIFRASFLLAVLLCMLFSVVFSTSIFRASFLLAVLLCMTHIAVFRGVFIFHFPRELSLRYIAMCDLYHSFSLSVRLQSFRAFLLWALLLCMTFIAVFHYVSIFHFLGDFSVGCVAMYDPYQFFFIVCSSSVFQGIFCGLCCYV